MRLSGRKILYILFKAQGGETYQGKTPPGKRSIKGDAQPH